MRLIDADALAQTLGITNMNCNKCELGINGHCQRGQAFVTACMAIEEAPTILERNGKWTDPICRQELLAILYTERSKENGLKCNALKHRHFEEANAHHHAVQVLNKVILIVRGMEAEDAETETD